MLCRQILQLRLVVLLVLWARLKKLSRHHAALAGLGRDLVRHVITYLKLVLLRSLLYEFCLVEINLLVALAGYLANKSLAGRTLQLRSDSSLLQRLLNVEICSGCVDYGFIPCAQSWILELLREDTFKPLNLVCDFNNERNLGINYLVVQSQARAGL